MLDSGSTEDPRGEIGAAWQSVSVTMAVAVMTCVAKSVLNTDSTTLAVEKTGTVIQTDSVATTLLVS